jgi:predicted nucleotidyltransferase component of viral defense system
VSAGLDEEIVVDLAVDHRLAPAESGPLGPVLALDDLAADKLLALFGRAEARDFVDVWALAQVMATERLLELARTKDPGFDAYVLATMIGTLDRHPRSELEIDDASVVSLRQFFAGFRASLIHGTLGEVGR